MRAARRTITFLLAAIALVLLIRTVLAGREELADAFAAPRWAALAGLVAAAAAAMVWIALAWESVLRALGSGLGRSRAVGLYFVGELGKYVPGAVWPVVGRAELATRAGVPRPVAYASVLLSLAYMYLAGLVVAAVAAGVALAGDVGSSAPLLLLLVLPAGVACLHPAVSGRAFGWALHVLRGDWTAAPAFPSWPASIRLLLVYVPPWVAVAVATWCAAQALRAEAGFAHLALAGCLAWVAGFLIVPAPGGLGAREAVFTALLGTTVADGRAAAVAVLARLAFVVVDVVGAALGVPSLRRDKRPRERAERGRDVEVPGD